MEKQGTIIYNAKIYTEKNTFRGSVRIEGEFIAEIFKGEIPPSVLQKNNVIDASDLWLLPGVIDSHVHFREPGLTEKGTMESETKAALAGGVTSFIDMPNTIPPTFSHEALTQKLDLASKKAWINYGFFLGASADHIDDILKISTDETAGIKLFYGSTTGNLTVDKKIIEDLMKSSKHLLVVHAEDDEVIKRNLQLYSDQYGETIPYRLHPAIRSSEACYKATSTLVEMALRHRSRLHIAHISTSNEIALFDNSKPLTEKQITAEVCVPYLWFDQRNYDQLGAFMKSNPAIKSENDKKALMQALTNNKIDTVSTDHAPHLKTEKTGNYFQTPSGIPSVQFALPLMLELAREGHFTIEKVIEKMSYAPATLFRIHRRGFIRKGYYADLVLVNPDDPWTIAPETILSKCAWSPYEGTSCHAKITHTFVNGQLQFENGTIMDHKNAKALLFNQPKTS
ncbi:MAG: dihydroorotase [Microbacter sp.]